MTSPNVAGTGLRDVEQSRPADPTAPAGTRSTDRARLRELAAAATPGPWHEDDRYVRGSNRTVADCRYRNGVADAAYITAVSPDVILALLDESGPPGPSRAPEEAGEPRGPESRDHLAGGESIGVPGDAVIRCPGDRCLTLIPAANYLCWYCARTYAMRFMAEKVTE